MSPQRLQNPAKQGTPEPGCQTSPKECSKIGKIGKNREESETVSPQRLQKPAKPAQPPKQGTPEPGCQTSPKECMKIGNREDREDIGKKVRL